MDVVGVGHEPLIPGRSGSKRQIRLVARSMRPHRERRQKSLEAAALALVRLGKPAKTPARERADGRGLGGGRQSGGVVA